MVLMMPDLIDVFLVLLTLSNGFVLVLAYLRVYKKARIARVLSVLSVLSVGITAIVWLLMVNGY